jgi:hypothetical protein
MHKVEEVFGDAVEARRRFSMYHYAVNYCPGNPKYSAVFAPAAGSWQLLHHEDFGVSDSGMPSGVEATEDDNGEGSELAAGTAVPSEAVDLGADDQVDSDARSVSVMNRETDGDLAQPRSVCDGENSAEPVDPLDVQFPVVSDPTHSGITSVQNTPVTPVDKVGPVSTSV